MGSRGFEMETTEEEEIHVNNLNFPSKVRGKVIGTCERLEGRRESSK